MASVGIRRLALIFSLALAPSVACMTNHDALEKKPTVPVGSGGVGGVSGSASHVLTGGTGGQLATGGHPDDEAPGTSVLTLTNGVVDAPSVVVCFAKVETDGTVTPFGAPLSDSPLGYGQSLILPTIPGADEAADVLEPFVIAGQLDLVSGLDCAAAIDLARTEEAATLQALGSAGAASSAEAGAGGAASDPSEQAESDAGGAGGASGAGGAEVQSRLRVRGLPAIPAGTLNGGRSYLLVATGCLGGAGFNASKAEQYCGAGYSERAPTVSAVFVALSRASSSSDVGLQVVHASLATGNISVQSLAPPPGGDAISIVTSEVQGGLEPRPAYIAHTAADYGSARGYHLEIDTQNATPFTENWVDVLMTGGIDALEDGSNYALVLVGPSLGRAHAQSFWNAPALTVVSADPK